MAQDSQLKSEPQVRSTGMVRRYGYNFCEKHQQEYLQYCCWCALEPYRRKSSRQRAEEAVSKSKTRDAKW